jgi:hypothetical protein
MKKYFCFLLFGALLLSSCMKTTEDSNTDKLAPADEEYYNKILALQEQASGNFETWILTMDSVAALNKVQQMFAQNSLVSSATLGRQGVTVQYTNGIRGGIFVFPKDHPGAGSKKPVNTPQAPPAVKRPHSRVNIKQAVFLNPSYWERTSEADFVLQHYNTALPEISYSLDDIYKNQDATLDRFTKLAGHGLIHVFSHGLAWPDDVTLTDVYLKTGEETSLASTFKYWHDIYVTKSVIVMRSKDATGWQNIYFINEEFIAGHNDFKKDTVLFYGGFCYSFLGNWYKISDKFAKGTYFGFGWSVYSDNNTGWAVSLVESLCDTTARPPNTSGIWFAGENPPKSYYDSDDQKTVYLFFYEDSMLSLWQPPEADFSWSSGSQSGPTQICAKQSVTVKDLSRDHGEPIQDWQWYFQNGEPQSFNGQQPPAIYFNTVGSGSIKLVITNPFGKSTKEVSFGVVKCK